MDKKIWKSVWAVFAALLVIFVVTTIIDIILHGIRFFPGWDQKLNDLHAAVASVYRVLTGIMGGYIVARLAPSKPMTHALILGFIGVVISSLGAIFMGGMGPAWYSIGLIVVSLPCSWLGAVLYGTKV
ncbi:hypothetical protein ACE5IS_13875 [Leptospira wolffii]|uniref:Uncharacterized protein n=1 Tax=Leptospira wolffii TaxID=409998 RepID=A0ABV5BQA7_9LEPT|nr:hypothetical protein [Leptospira wolffii]TGL45728.1 hypothetical protein EHQ61_18520 [Leptospira wolffii]